MSRTARRTIDLRGIPRSHAGRELPTGRCDRRSPFPRRQKIGNRERSEGRMAALDLLQDARQFSPRLPGSGANDAGGSAILAP
jgi:hypothetical protein